MARRRRSFPPGRGPEAGPGSAHRGPALAFVRGAPLALLRISALRAGPEARGAAVPFLRGASFAASPEVRGAAVPLVRGAPLAAGPEVRGAALPLLRGAPLRPGTEVRGALPFDFRLLVRLVAPFVGLLLEVRRLSPHPQRDAARLTRSRPVVYGASAPWRRRGASAL